MGANASRRNTPTKPTPHPLFPWRRLGSTDPRAGPLCAPLLYSRRASERAEKKGSGRLCSFIPPRSTLALARRLDAPRLASADQRLTTADLTRTLNRHLRARCRIHRAPLPLARGSTGGGPASEEEEHIISCCCSGQHPKAAHHAPGAATMTAATDAACRGAFQGRHGVGGSMDWPIDVGGAVVIMNDRYDRPTDRPTGRHYSRTHPLRPNQTNSNAQAPRGAEYCRPHQHQRRRTALASAAGPRHQQRPAPRCPARSRAPTSRASAS